MKISLFYISLFLFHSISVFSQVTYTAEEFIRIENQSLFGNLKNIYIFYGTEPAWKSDELPDIESIKQKIHFKIPSLKILDEYKVNECDAQLAFDFSRNNSPIQNEFYGKLSYRVLRYVKVINSGTEHLPNVIV